MSSGPDGNESAGSSQVDACAKPAGRKKREGYDLEDPFQIEVAAFLDLCLPVGSWWCHIPNGGKRPMRTAIRLKKMGTKAGAPDNLIIYGGKSYWIELKARYGALQQSQLITIPMIERAGAPVEIVRTLDEVAAALTGWGIPLRVSLEAFRNRSKTAPNRMSASQYRVVMGLDAGQPKTKKAVASWQTPKAATRRRSPTRAKSTA